MLVCLYEDRPHQVTGLKILLLTLERFCPAWPVRLRFPGIADPFRKWLKRFPQAACASRGYRGPEAITSNRRCCWMRLQKEMIHVYGWTQISW